MMRKLLARLPKLCRLMAYWAFVFTLLSLLAARALHAQVEKAALGLGHQLAGLADLTRGGHSVLLNGARLHYARVTTNEPLERVLDRLEAHCDSAPGLLARDLQNLAQKDPGNFAKQFSDRALGRGIVSHRTGTSGVVLCLLADPSRPHASFGEALKQFVRSSDLAELGRVRYAYADRVAGERTRVVSFWNDGRFDLSAMFPASGDAEGSDSRVLPRPPEARRTLSAAIEGAPYAVRSYVSNRSRSALEQFYVRWLSQRNWTFGAQADGTLTYFRNDGYQIFVSFDEYSGQTFVTLTEAGRAAGNIAAVEVQQ